ncbi:MAG: EamA family transporter [Candidatus Bathyarchaeia archaeon]
MRVVPVESTTLALLFVTILGWGLWGFLQKIGVSEVGRDASLLFCYSSMFLTILGYLALTQGIKPSYRKPVVYPVLGGMASAIGTITFFTALERVPVSVARPIAGLCILVTAALGFLLLGERLMLRQYVGIGLAIAALVLLSG